MFSFTKLCMMNKFNILRLGSSHLWFPLINPLIYKSMAHHELMKQLCICQRNCIDWLWMGMWPAYHKLLWLVFWISACWTSEYLFILLEVWHSVINLLVSLDNLNLCSLAELSSGCNLVNVDNAKNIFNNMYWGD